MATITRSITPTVSIGLPKDGASVVGQSIPVTGTVRVMRETEDSITHNTTEEDIANQIDQTSTRKVEVKVGTGDYQLVPPDKMPPASSGMPRQWSFTGSIPSSGASLKITAKVTFRATVDGEVRDLIHEASVTVNLDTTGPSLTITPLDSPTVTLEDGEVSVLVKGTASDPSGVKKVEWKLSDASTFTLAKPAPNNTWSTWTASVTLRKAGEQTIEVRAQDNRNNIGTPKTLTVDVALPFLPKDPADVFDAAAYLDDLLLFAKNRVKVGPTGPELDRSLLIETFHQPFDALTDPARRDVAHRPVRQVRICVEALRGYLTPSQTQQSTLVGAEKDYRLEAYDMLLNQIGTSYEEVRSIRAAEPEVHRAMADRLGIEVGCLNSLFLNRETMTEQDLEKLLGLADTRRDPLSEGAKLGDPQEQITRWNLDSVEWGKNTDSEGTIYVGLEHPTASSFTVVLFRDPARTKQVASGTRSTSVGTVKLSGVADSGLSGSIDINYKANSNTIEISAVPNLLAWRLEHLRALWKEQDRPSDRPLEGDPIIDPDLIGADDLKKCPPVGGAEPDPACDLWLDRRAWVDSQLSTLKTTRQQPGTFSLKWGGVGTGDGQFQSPYDVAVDGQGNIYVADRNNHRVQKFDANGTFLTEWGSGGTGDGQFQSPTGIGVDGQGNIYAADRNNHRVQKFDANGTFLAKWGSGGTGDGQFQFPEGIAVDGYGDAYVADTVNHRIQKFDANGTFLTKWGSQGNGNGQFKNPFRMVVDSYGNVYVADTDNHRVQKFDANGTFLAKWGGQGSADGQFRFPSGMLVDSHGDIYVADKSNHRVQKFDANGTFLAKWGGQGSGNGQFQFPFSVAADAYDDNVYVADTNNHRIQKFDAPAGLGTIIENTLGVPLEHLIALADANKRGNDITAEIQELDLTNDTFSYLLRFRDLVLSGTSVLESEWEDVYSILVQVQKRREFVRTGGWLEQEENEDITLSPDYFRIPEQGTAIPSLPAWRATASARRAWQDKLRARIDQEQAVIVALHEAVSTTEESTLPMLRNALVMATDVEGAELETKAPRITKLLMIDAQTSGSQKTTRINQAIETLQGVLFAVRIERFAEPHPAAGWDLNGSGGYTDAKFDEEWRWMGAHATWRAAMSVFIYPENNLLPSLRPAQASLAANQRPTQAFRDLVTRLRANPRLTPAKAREEAKIYLDELRNKVSTTLPSDFRITDQLTEDGLASQRTLSKNLSGSITSPHQAPNWLQETFYFVPALLALHLQQSGQYLAALDWLQTVYAYNLRIDQRKIYHGLVLDANVPTAFARTIDWLLEGLNPHEIARVRSNALTRFTILSLVRCFLAFADAEFARDTRESVPRARSLYETALELLDLPEMEPPTAGAVAPPASQLPPNPVLQALRLHADQNLLKLRNGRNIAGLERQLEPVAAQPGTSVVSRQPTPYRYPVIIERAKQLVTIAQQIEATFLAALEKRDAEAYNLLKARQDLQLSRAGVQLQDLRLKEAKDGIALAQLQQERAQSQVDHFQGLLASPLNELETFGSIALGFAAAAQFTSGIGIVSAAGSLLGQFASYQQREKEWRSQLALAQQDVRIGAQQVKIAGDHVSVVRQERTIAAMQADHAEDTLEFLANKFTNAELFDWMSGILERVYSFFLQQATAMAKLAEQQLAFERQETPPAFIRADYWEVSADEGPVASADGQSPDRRGLTGSARLLQDIFELDQYTFDTDKRKLQLTKTIPLSQLAPVEFQRFRQTGVMIFATPLELFDRDFPGHYLRLVKRTRTSVIALIPPTQGIRATLSTIGTSRVVIGGDTFQTTLVSHGPQSVALSAPRDATGLFELDHQPEMRLPFEGIGVATIWELRMPKAANPFDYRTIADVLLTLEYTALDSTDYRQQVIQTLNPSISADRPLSFRHQFADQWYDLHNPDQTATPMNVRFETAREDFPPNVDDLKVQHVLLYFARANGQSFEASDIHLRFSEAGTQGSVGGGATPTDGVISTRRGNAPSWAPMIGRSPYGKWELTLPNTEELRNQFENEEIEDILFVITYSGRTPEWPI